jgi:ribosome recycling factor
MDDVVEDARRRLAALRVGRASVDMIADLRVSAWGSDMPLSQVAQLGTQPPRGLVATPYDPSLLPAIERALGNSDLGARPRVDGIRVRVELPAPTDEGRTRLARQAKDQAEQSRVAVRLARRDAINELRRMRAADEIGEGRLNGRSRDLQAMCDERIASIDALLATALAALAD